MAINPEKSIPAFYAGQSILLTGATGFLGKVLVEKILRTCPDVREIFLLMRPIKGLSVSQRLEKLLNLPLFERLRNERPSNFKKLIPISGDTKEKELGLSVSDKQMLIERVSMIIHGAASVRFNNSLQYAILTNTRSTRDICMLAQNMKNLTALIYVSTAFAHINEPFVEEKSYPPIADWRKMIDIAESLDGHTLNIFTAKCLRYAPNTYIFSKNLSEAIIHDYSSLFPCGIVRPSSVMPTLKEPIPGWIDNVYGPIGLFVGGGKGLLRVACCTKSVTEDLVPADIVVKSILVTGWKLGITSFITADFKPFVINSVCQTPMSYGSTVKLLCSVINEIPYEKSVWVPNTILTDNMIIFYILTILLHILPAIIIDSILYVFGRRRMFLNLMRRLYVANRAVGYFSFHERQFGYINRLNLLNSIPSNDLEMFSFDYTNVNMRKIAQIWVIGSKQYLLHEPMSRLDIAHTNRKRMYWFVTILETTIFINILWIIFKYMYSL